MIKILVISGSLRASSSNTAILQTLIKLAPVHVDISIYSRLGDLPHFNPDIDLENSIKIPVVKDWRTQLKNADGIVICTPEYAHGVPGVLKNALDWIVSSGEFMHKPTAVISASPSPDGGKRAHASLVQTLRMMMAEMKEETMLRIPAVSAKLSDQGILTDADTERSLASLLDALVKEIDKR
jgi:chromate reductase, NAD(P)H dehydrogenase (quinone)